MAKDGKVLNTPFYVFEYKLNDAYRKDVYFKIFLTIFKFHNWKHEMEKSRWNPNFRDNFYHAAAKNKNISHIKSKNKLINIIVKNC